MKTLTTQYKSADSLKHFIQNNQIALHKNILLQIFTAYCDLGFIENLLQTIQKLIPHAKVIGATTAGEIFNANAQTNSTILSFSLFQETDIETYAIEKQENSYATGVQLVKQFNPKRSAKVAISFADGLHINGEEYLNAFKEYNPHLIIAGGLAGDNSKFSQTIVFTEKVILTEGVVIALLYNENLTVATNASFGWEHIGKTMTITKANKNVVYEIDNQKAVAIYRKYLGEDVARELPNVGIEFPLIIKKEGLSIPRAVIGRNADDSLSFAGSLKEGDRVTFGYGNMQTILQYGHKLYKDTTLQKSESIFVYSCMARLKLLNEHINIELSVLQNICDVNGFFTYGEFYYEQQNADHKLLNQTMTILGLSENNNQKQKRHFQQKSIKKDRRKTNLTLKAFSHLVTETSKELEEMNLLLQERVAKEVEKNRQKDKAMLHQSKLAQMGEMMSMIAHQWRQPLSAIGSLSQALTLKATLGSLQNNTVMEFAQTITEHTQYLSTTIDDFREFFRPKKEKKDTNYTEIIESVLKIIESSIVTKNIQLVKDFQTDAPFYSYPNEIKQVVLNLIKNAEDALLENNVANPCIIISTYQQEEYAILEVRDNAGGVPPHLCEKIFEPYFSTKLEKNGTGLGLYMSKTIIEEHCGGRLRVLNTDEGASFQIAIKTQAQQRLLNA